MVPEPVLSAIQSADRILLISHIEPDGDAYGSMLGMKWILEAAGKKTCTGIDSKSDSTYAFLPGHGTVRRPSEVKGPFDLVVITDSSSIDRLGEFRYVPLVQQAPWVVIDHHPTNTRFGGRELNWVAPEHISACNMVVHLCEQLGYECNAKAKKCLMTGMVTDSQCFRVYATDEEFMKDVLEVMGPDSFRLYDVVSQTLGAQSFSELQMWAKVLPSLRLEAGVVWLTMQEHRLVQPGERVKTGGLIQKLTEVKEAEISVIFTERTQNDGRHGVTCSFRCRPQLDVSELAHRYGGGGHQLAAGCFIEAPLLETVKQVVSELKQIIADSKVEPVLQA